MVALRRIERELQATEKLNPGGEVLVTCGTILETTIYAAVFALSNSQSGNGTISLVNDKRAMSTMSWLGITAHDTWDYDYVFYLPYDGEDKWESIIDDHVGEAADSLGVKLITLSKVRDERIAQVVQELQSYEWEADAEATTTE